MKHMIPYPESYPTLIYYVGQIMIRYRINDEKLFSSIKTSDALLNEMYQKLVMSDPLEKSVDFTRILHFVHPKKMDYSRSLICLSEFLTEPTMDVLAMFPDVRLAAVSKNIKANHEQFVECITKIYWLDKIEYYIDSFTCPDLPDSSKVNLLSHLFFVDEAEHLAEIHGAEFLVRICIGLLIPYACRE
jgi:hypothetical protein